MANVKVLNIKILADIREFSNAMKDVTRQSKAIGRELEDVGKTLTYSVTAPLAAMAVVSLKAFADIDQLKRGLIAVSGSAAAAEEEFQKLRKVAELPGLGLEEAVRGSINLQAIGVSADEARRTMLAFGNAIATVGGGKENFDLAIRGFSQLRNAAKPLQQDLYQIANQLPQVNKLMIEAFGTNRAEDLAAMGITGKQLAEFLVSSLEQLPPVTGGIKNAFENFGDTMKVTFASIGESLNKAFDVEGIINTVSGTISDLVEKFKSLSPETQKAIFAIAGIAAAAGPVLFVLGTLGTTVIPNIIRGMGLLRAAFLTNPFGIIAAAVATAVYLIVQNWDKIVEYFSSGDGSGAFEKLRVIVEAAMTAINGIIEFSVLFIADIWEAVGGPVLNYIQGLFQNIVDRIDSALGYVLALAENMLARLIGIWKFFKGLFTADWSLMWEGLVDVVASFVNAITEGIRFMVRNVLGPIKTLADAVGLDGVSGAMTTALDSVDSFFNAIKIESEGAKQAADIVDNFKKSIVGVREEAKKPIPSPIQEGPKGVVMPDLNPKGDDKEAEKKRKEAMQAEELANLRAFTKAKQQIELDYANGIIKTEAEANMKKAEANITYRQANLDTAKKFNLKELEAKDEYEKAVFERDLLAAEQKKATEDAKRLAQKQLREDTISGGLQVLGALRNFAGQSKGLALFEIAVNTAIGLSRAIKAGAGLPFPTNIPAILSGTTAVLSGMTAAKNALSKAPAFAEGGAVMGGPTLSLLGDNPSGKEAIIPFEKMTEFASRMVGNVGGGVIQVVGEVKIAGRDMLLLIRNAERAEERGFA